MLFPHHHDALLQSRKHIPEYSSWVLSRLIAQVFVLLVAEMAIFVALIVPLPYTIKRKLFTFVSENPLVAKLQYGLKVSNPFGNVEHC